MRNTLSGDTLGTSPCQRHDPLSLLSPPHDMPLQQPVRVQLPMVERNVTCRTFPSDIACQPSAAPTGSTPGCSKPWAIDSASVSATVLVQSHPAQSPVVAAPRTVEASLHLAFGLGSGWMLTDAMFIEAAHMGQTQPEGLALATYLTGSGMIANVMVVPLFYYLQRRLSWRIERWVWVGLLFQISSAVLAALSWLGRLRAPP